MRPIDTATFWFSVGQLRTGFDANPSQPADRWPDVARETRAAYAEIFRAALAATGSAADGRG